MSDLHDAFGRLDDEAWRTVLLRSVTSSEIDGVRMPTFPSDVDQARFTSRCREDALEEAFKYYRFVKGVCREVGEPIGRQTRLLDFGVGWGRIVRMFMKDIPARNIVGVDVNAGVVEWCRQLVPYGTYLPCRHGEPLPVATAQLDLVTAYSVFSHLSPTTQLMWIAELARVLRPGGLAVVTTLSRVFRAICRSAMEAPEQSDFHAGLAAAVRGAYPDWQTALADADDSRRMLYLPSGGGLDGLEPAHYGWAMVPRQYAEEAWRPWFDVVRYVDDPALLEQAVFVLRRR